MSRLRGARSACVVALGLLVGTAYTGDLRAQGLKLTGYGDVEWTLQQVEAPDQDWHHFFDNHHFNLVAVAWVIEDLVAAAEVEYEHAGEEIVLEYGYLAYTGLRGIRFAGGKFILPFNRWNKDLHPSFISKVPGRPIVNNNVFPSTYSDVGIWVSGGLPLANSGSRVVYDAYVVNGLKGDQDESNWRDLRDNDRERPDQENNKSFGGRLGIELAQGLGLGVSGYAGRYATDSLTSEGLDIVFLGGDIDYHLQGLELRGEFIYGKQDLSQSAGGEDKRTGFYVQGAYLLTQAQNALANLEPVVRYSWIDFDAPGADIQELAVGASYYLSASSSVRLAYFFNFEEAEPETDNDALRFQFNVLF